VDHLHAIHVTTHHSSLNSTVIMSSMQAYLAEKYMSGPKADAILSRTTQKKKKKRKPDLGSTSASGMIVDDDAGWNNVAISAEADDDDDDDTEAVVASDRSFKKRRMEPGEGGSGWATVREPTPPPPADEQPVVVSTEEEQFHGGLMTKKQLRSQLPSQDRRIEEEEDPAALAAAQETVYRDASGRKVDMKLERAEAARKKREREEREAQKMEWGKGLVQRDEAERRKKEEERIRQRGFARYVDDADLNRTQKEQERWNDPAAAFMTVCSPCNLGDHFKLTPVITDRKRERRALGNPNTQARRHLQTGLVSNLGIGGTVWVR
jgi:pre-mRNA-splicing factor CWC26